MLFDVTHSEDGVLGVTLNRPPVNAVNLAGYRAIRDLARSVTVSTEVKAVVITSAEGGKAWCGGADLTEIDTESDSDRVKRYRTIEETLDAFAGISVPVIAALNNHFVGLGFTLATLCDIRVAADDIFFAIPEIDRGLVFNPVLLRRTGLPEGLIREMLFSGRRFKVDELGGTGFFNYVLPRDQVLPKAMALASVFAGKSREALTVYKAVMNESENMTWREAYTVVKSRMVAIPAGLRAEGIAAFKSQASR